MSGYSSSKFSLIKVSSTYIDRILIYNYASIKAETEIFNVYVRLFSKFTIGPELDATGTPMYTNLNDFEDYGIVVKPLPFKACLIPRNKK